MVTVETVLAVIGAAGPIGATIRWCVRHLPEPPVEEDIAAPYREGLRAAIRTQVVAQDLEKQVHAGAMRHAKGAQAVSPDTRKPQAHRASHRQPSGRPYQYRHSEH